MRLSEILEEKKKNCGCGKDPCETYGKQQESKDEYKPHMMYKGSKKDYRAKYPTKKKHHDSLMKRGYNHDDPETDKVEERYGMRTSNIGQRQAQSDMVNTNKRANNKAQDQNREMMIRQKSANRRAGRLQTKTATGLPSRLLNPQQPQAPEAQG